MIQNYSVRKIMQKIIEHLLKKCWRNWLILQFFLFKNIEVWKKTPGNIFKKISNKNEKYSKKKQMIDLRKIGKKT